MNKAFIDLCKVFRVTYNKNQLWINIHTGLASYEIKFSDNKLWELYKLLGVEYYDLPSLEDFKFLCNETSRLVFEVKGAYIYLKEYKSPSLIATLALADWTKEGWSYNFKLSYEDHVRAK